MTTSYTHFAPLRTVEEFSSDIGLTLRTVEAWVMRGYVPTVKVGRHRLINVAALVATGGLDQATAPARLRSPQRSEESAGGLGLGRLPSPPNGNYGGDDK